MRIKEQETRPILPEHDDDDDGKNFLETLDKLIVEENYLPQPIVKMNETSPLWKSSLRGLSSIRRPSQSQVSRFV